MEISINGKIVTFVPSEIQKSYFDNSLILTKKYPIKCFDDFRFESEINRKSSPKLSVGPGVKIGNDSVYFTCSYPLYNIHATQDYSVISVKTSVNRTNIGHLDYKIKLSKSEYKIGKKISFEIIPINPGLVFSKLKYCTVTHPHNDKLKYDLYWSAKDSRSNFCKDKIVNFNKDNPSVTKYNITGYFTAFSWDSSVNETGFLLNCDLDLSINKPEVSKDQL